MAEVITLGACTVENLSFTTNAPSVSIVGFSLTPADISVAALPSTMSVNTDPGIQFSAAFKNPGTIDATAMIGFGATLFPFPIPPGSGISDASLTVSGIATGTLFTDVETIATPFGIFSLDADQTNPSPATVSFTAGPSVGVDDTLTVFPNPSATVTPGVSILDLRFSETVPEPPSLALLIASLLGLGVFWRLAIRLGSSTV